MSDWPKLHKHYNDIKTKHNLFTIDILRQISYERYIGLEYLRPSGINHNVSNRKGTNGREFLDVLRANIDKTDWLPSTATYSDKLVEMNLDNCCLSASIKEYIDDRPCLDICLEPESRDFSKEELERLYTIDDVIPMIVSVNRLIYI
jgi:hypothetical protein